MIILYFSSVMSNSSAAQEKLAVWSLVLVRIAAAVQFIASCFVFLTNELHSSQGLKLLCCGGGVVLVTLPQIAKYVKLEKYGNYFLYIFLKYANAHFQGALIHFYPQTCFRE